MLIIFTAVTALFVFRYEQYVDENILMAEESIKSKGFTLDRINKQKWEWTDSNGITSGYAYLGKGNGYSDEIIVLTYTNSKHLIQEVVILSHTETYSYYNQLIKKNFFEKLLDKNLSEMFDSMEIDVVSGATISCEAILSAINESYREAEVIDN